MTRASVSGINHLTLSVSDLSRAVAFYSDVLGAVPAAEWDTGAYLQLGTLWLCLAHRPDGAKPARDYSHIALDCAADDFTTLAGRISAAATLWQDNTSEGQSVYFLDPDGHRLELHVGTLADRIAHYRDNPHKGVTIHG